MYVDIAVFDRRYRYYRLNEFIRQKKHNENQNRKGIGQDEW